MPNLPHTYTVRYRRGSCSWWMAWRYSVGVRSTRAAAAAQWASMSARHIDTVDVEPRLHERHEQSPGAARHVERGLSGLHELPEELDLRAAGGELRPPPRHQAVMPCLHVLHRPESAPAPAPQRSSICNWATTVAAGPSSPRPDVVRPSGLELPERRGEADLLEQTLCASTVLGANELVEVDPRTSPATGSTSGPPDGFTPSGWLPFDRRNSMVLQVKTMSSHHRLAGRRSRCSRRCCRVGHR